MAKKNELMALDPEMQALMAGSSVDPVEQRSNIDDVDKREPRISLMQGLSEFVSSGEASLGDIVHGADAYKYADAGQDFTVIPVMYWKNRTLFEDVEQGVGQQLCSAPDSHFGIGSPGGKCDVCPNSEWSDTIDKAGHQKRLPPPCRAQHNFLMYVPTADPAHQIAIMSFAKTNYPVGTKILNRLLGLPGNYWMYGFQFFSRQSGEGKTKWWVFDLKQHDDTGKFEKPINMLLPDTYKPVFKQCEEFYQQFKGIYGKAGGEPNGHADTAAPLDPTVKPGVEPDEVPF